MMQFPPMPPPPSPSAAGPLHPTIGSLLQQLYQAPRCLRVLASNLVRGSRRALACSLAPPLGTSCPWVWVSTLVPLRLRRALSASGTASDCPGPDHPQHVSFTRISFVNLAQARVDYLMPKDPEIANVLHPSHTKQPFPGTEKPKRCFCVGGLENTPWPREPKVAKSAAPKRTFYLL